jgi:hypothetical protein
MTEEITYSFRTLCHQLVEAADKQQDHSPEFQQVLSLAKEALESRPLVIPPKVPSNDELQNLWVGEVPLEGVAKWPTRAVWFARTVLERWGRHQDI